MPGFLVHFGATVLCAHAGQAQPTAVNPRVLVSGQPMVTVTAPYVVAGCALPPPPAANRPSSGRGLLRLVFAPNRDELATATQLLVQGALHQWLGDLIAVDDVQVEHSDATLAVTVRYTVRRTQQPQTALFARGGALG